MDRSYEIGNRVPVTNPSNIVEYVRITGFFTNDDELPCITVIGDSADGDSGSVSACLVSDILQLCDGCGQSFDIFREGQATQYFIVCGICWSEEDARWMSGGVFAN